MIDVGQKGFLCSHYENMTYAYATSLFVFQSNAGITTTTSPPTYDSNTHKLSWNGSDWQIDELNSGELTKVKQADVVLLNYPLLWKMPEDVLINDLNLYEDITDEYGPAMTWSIFAIKYTLYIQNKNSFQNMQQKSFFLPFHFSFSLDA